MSHPTPLDSWVATVFARESLPLTEVLPPRPRQLAAVLLAYRRGAISPQATWQPENDSSRLAAAVTGAVLPPQRLIR